MAWHAEQCVRAVSVLLLNARRADHSPDELWSQSKDNGHSPEIMVTVQMSHDHSPDELWSQSRW